MDAIILLIIFATIACKSPFIGCTCAIIGQFIELFAYIPNKSSHIIGTNLLNCLLTIVICSCYNKNNSTAFLLSITIESQRNPVSDRSFHQEGGVPAQIYSFGPGIPDPGYVRVRLAARSPFSPMKVSP